MFIVLQDCVDLNVIIRVPWCQMTNSVLCRWSVKIASVSSSVP